MGRIGGEFGITKTTAKFTVLVKQTYCKYMSIEAGNEAQARKKGIEIAKEELPETTKDGWWVEDDPVA